jgi:precorrin-3B synthase
MAGTGTYLTDAERLQGNTGYSDPACSSNRLPQSAPVRGACPSLSAPMATGDGYLVRLRPRTPGLSPYQFRQLAEAAARHGNGLMEVTARGNLQIRGLRAGTVPKLADDLVEAGILIEAGIQIETPPLAGIDQAEHADARAMADRLRQAIRAIEPPLALAPKLSIVVDGAGGLRLDALPADIRLTADTLRRDTWRLSIAGTARTAQPLAVLSSAKAIAETVDLLARLHSLGTRARARDLSKTELASRFPLACLDPLEDLPAPKSPIGTHRIEANRIAVGFRLAYGRIGAADLIAFLAAADGLGAREIRAAHDHALLLLGATEAGLGDLERVAKRHGLSSCAEDPVNRIAACSGAGACASAFFRTREIAGDILDGAPALFGAPLTVHVSGCAKGCAHPGAAEVAIVGTPIGYGLVVNGSASQAPIAYIDKRKDLKSALRSLARLLGDRKEAGESVRACLTRLGTDTIRAALVQG